MTSSSCAVKIIVLGMGAVGKSCLSIRFVQNTFFEEYEPTIENNYSKTITLNEKTYQIEILDTAGMETNEALKPPMYKARDCFILVYAINDPASFEYIQNLHDDIVRILGKETVPCVICGNKSDLGDERKIPTQEGQRIATQYSAAFLETSAKTGENVDDAMIQAVKEYLKTKPDEATDNKEKRKKKLCNLI